MNSIDAILATPDAVLIVDETSFSPTIGKFFWVISDNFLLYLKTILDVVSCAKWTNGAISDNVRLQYKFLFSAAQLC